MSGDLVAIRLALPPAWQPLALDDPDACMAALADELLPDPDDPKREALADALFMEYGLLAMGNPQDLAVLLPEPFDAVHATLVTALTTAHLLFRKNLQGYAGRVARDLRALGARTVERRDVDLPSGPAVRLRAVAADDLGRRRDMVVHVVVPDGARGAVLLRVQWEPDRPDAAQLADVADRIAREALVEVVA